MSAESAEREFCVNLVEFRRCCGLHVEQTCPMYLDFVLLRFEWFHELEKAQQTL